MNLNAEQIEDLKKQGIYRIYEGNVERLGNKLAILGRRAVKLGLAPFSLIPAGIPDEIESRNINPVGLEPKIQLYRFVFLQFKGEQPKFAGWSLAACVEHTDEGNILRKSPECTIELNSFREGAQRCDHCHALRNRRETFIVSHADGSLKMVGSDCIKDFLGHTDPRQLLAGSACLFSASELLEGAEDSEFFGGGFYKELYSVETLLNFAACAIRIKGFVSRKTAHEQENKIATADHASHWMKPSLYDKLGVDYFLPEDCDIVAAAAARQFVLDTLGAKDELNDFEHNLLTVCKCEVVDRKNMGIVAFVPEYFARETQKRVEKERNAADASKSVYFGEVGKRVKDVSLTYLKSTGFSSQFGYTYIHSFSAPAGERILWMTSTDLSFQVGEVFVAKFTVKAHEEYKGWKQTKISRLVIAD